MIARQLRDDGICRKGETGNSFVTSLASEDVLVISLCNNRAEKRALRRSVGAWGFTVIVL